MELSEDQKFQLKNEASTMIQRMLEDIPEVLSDTLGTSIDKDEEVDMDMMAEGELYLKSQIEYQVSKLLLK